MVIKKHSLFFNFTKPISLSLFDFFL
jgi:hypothetical protein